MKEHRQVGGPSYEELKKQYGACRQDYDKNNERCQFFQWIEYPCQRNSSLAIIGKGISIVFPKARVSNDYIRC